MNSLSTFVYNSRRHLLPILCLALNFFLGLTSGLLGHLKGPSFFGTDFLLPDFRLQKLRFRPRSTGNQGRQTGSDVQTLSKTGNGWKFSDKG